MPVLTNQTSFGDENVRLQIDSQTHPANQLPSSEDGRCGGSIRLSDHPKSSRCLINGSLVVNAPVPSPRTKEMQRPTSKTSPTPKLSVIQPPPRPARSPQRDPTHNTEPRKIYEEGSRLPNLAAAPSPESPRASETATKNRRRDEHMFSKTPTRAQPLTNHVNQVHLRPSEWPALPGTSSPLQELIYKTRNAGQASRSSLGTLLASSDSSSTIGKNDSARESRCCSGSGNQQTTPRGERTRHSIVGPGSAAPSPGRGSPSSAGGPSKSLPRRRKSISSPPSLRPSVLLKNLATPKLNRRSYSHHHDLVHASRKGSKDLYDLEGDSLESEDDINVDFASADEGDESFWDVPKKGNWTSQLLSKKSSKSPSKVSNSPSNRNEAYHQEIRLHTQSSLGRGTLRSYDDDSESDSYVPKDSSSDHMPRSLPFLSVHPPPSRAKSSDNIQSRSLSADGDRSSRRASSTYFREKSFFSSSVLQDSRPEVTSEPRNRDSLSLMAAHSEQLLERLISGQRHSLSAEAESFEDDADADDGDDAEEAFKDSESPPHFMETFKSSVLNHQNKFSTPSYPPQPDKSHHFDLPPIIESSSTSSSLNRMAMQRVASVDKLGLLKRSPNAGTIRRTKKSTSMTFNLRQLPKLLVPRSKEYSTDYEPQNQSTVRTVGGSGDNSHTMIRMSSQPSMRSHKVSDPSSAAPVKAPQTWRSSRTDEEYDQLLKRYGQTEMRRQEVIFELCQTESSFVEGLKTVANIFSRPLRRSTGTWVDGVPVIVGKLFESLEEIISLHDKICEAIDINHKSQVEINQGLVLSIADTYHKYIPKLDVYQAYLVRFEEVNTLIDELSNNPNSDFGEFIKMRSGLEECGKMNLSSFLLKPVQRLMKYPLFFKQLCDLTPPSHTDHRTTNQLLNSTDSIIQVMQEVKGLEDEYRALKVLEGRIRGLPAGFKLAVRDRKLLAQGTLRRIKVSSKARAEFDSEVASKPISTPSKTLEPASSTHSLIPLSLSLSLTRSNFYSKSMQRPLSQISDYSDFSSRSGKSSVTRSDCSHSSFWNMVPPTNEEPGLNPGSRTSGAESGPDNSPESKFNSYVPPLSSPMSAGDSAGGSKPDRFRPRTISAGRLLRKSKESQVYAFVFSDLIILCNRAYDGVRIMGRLKDISPELTAFEQIGLSRAIQVSLVGGVNDHESLIKLKILPSIPDGTGGIQASVERSQTILLGIQEPSSTRSRSVADFKSNNNNSSSKNESALAKERTRWLNAFEKSIVGGNRKNSKSPDNRRLISRSFSRSPSCEGFDMSIREEKIFWKERQRLVRNMILVNNSNNKR